MHLEEFDSEVFVAYFRWIYTAQIDSREMTSDSGGLDEGEPTLLSLVELWFLAEHLTDYELCSKVSDMIVDGVDGRLRGISTSSWRTSDLVSAADRAFHDPNLGAELRNVFADIFFVGMNTKYGPASSLLQHALTKTSREVLIELSKRWIFSKDGPDKRDVISIAGLEKNKYHKVRMPRKCLKKEVVKRQSSRESSVLRARSTSPEFMLSFE